MSESFTAIAKFIRELGFAAFLFIVLFQTAPAINRLAEKVDRLCVMVESRIGGIR